MLRSNFAVAPMVAALTLMTALVGSSPAGPDHYDDHNGDLSATIRYTEYGIPHVVAKDYAGLGFGQGYAAANDNICGIEQAMLTVSAQRSRHLGHDASPSSGVSRASTNLSSDLYFQGTNDSGIVERLAAVPAPLGPTREVRDATRGYAAGVSKYLREKRITDPACKDAAWLRPMTETDVYRVMYALGTIFGQASAADEIVSARPGGKQPAAATSTEDRNVGSNAIAFGAAATVGGQGISLGNPHVPWQTPDLRMWQAQLTIPGQLDASGVSLDIGTPFLWMGHNASVAWSGTAADATRTYTLFQLKLVPGTPTSYLVDGKPEAMQRRDVSVTVGQPDGGTHTVTQPQWWTRYGPVILRLDAQDLPWTADTAYAMADANAQNLRIANSMSRLMLARDADDVIKGLRETQGLSWQNILATDSSGKATYSQIHSVPNVTDEKAARCNTELGKRIFSEDGLAVLDGSRTDCAWGSDRDAVQPGIFGPANLPAMSRPDYVENSNESAWLTNPAQPLTGFARILGQQATERSARTRDGLTEIADQLAKGKFTRQSVQDLMFSNRNYVAERTNADVVRLCRGMGHEVSDACSVLSTWDLHNNIDSRGALLFDRFWLRVTDTAGANLWKVPFNANDPVNTPNTLSTDNPAIAPALAAAVAELRAAGIPLDAPFGDHHYVVRNGERIPIGGGTARLGVFNAIGGIWDPAKGYTEMAHGASYLHVVAFNGEDCPDTATVLAYSQSADQTSPHYSDQTKLYARKGWVTERFCEHDILASPELRVIELRQAQ